MGRWPLIMQRQDFPVQSTLLHGVVGCIRGVLTMGQLLMVLQQVQATYIHSLIYLHSLSWNNSEFVCFCADGSSDRAQCKSEPCRQIITEATAVDFIQGIQDKKLKHYEHGNFLILFACSSSLTLHLAFGNLTHVVFSRTVCGKGFASCLVGGEASNCNCPACSMILPKRAWRNQYHALIVTERSSSTGSMSAGEAYIALQHSKAAERLTVLLDSWQIRTLAEALDDREWNASLDHYLKAWLQWLEQEVGFAGEV